MHCWGRKIIINFFYYLLQNNWAIIYSYKNYRCVDIHLFYGHFLLFVIESRFFPDTVHSNHSFPFIHSFQLSLSSSASRYIPPLFFFLRKKRPQKTSGKLYKTRYNKTKVFILMLYKTKQWKEKRTRAGKSQRYPCFHSWNPPNHQTNSHNTYAEDKVQSMLAPGLPIQSLWAHVSLVS